MSPIVVGLSMTCCRARRERVTGFRVDVQLAAGGLFDRDEHARAGSLIA
jgi:hypothetical protein